MLLRIIDGNGYICITKTKEKYIKLCLVISLDIKDLSLLLYIQSILGLSIVSIYPKLGVKKICKLIINKTDLQNVFFPLLIYHNMFFLFKNRLTQYSKALYILRNNIILFSNIPCKSFSYYDLLKNNEDYLNLKNFDY
jgi:LAGLIDADG endonuclease